MTDPLSTISTSIPTALSNSSSFESIAVALSQLDSNMASKSRFLSHVQRLPPSIPQFLEFVNASPSPFHVVEEARKRLEAVGFKKLSERVSWQNQIQKGGKYYVVRNESSIVAFIVGGQYRAGQGTCIVAAHTDSPCLKVKPKSKKTKNGYLQLGVQTYGGGLWHTWFDRDLGVAGRVMVQTGTGVESKLVRIADPILRIPTLAIHLNRDVNDGFKFNNETQLTPILCSVAAAELNAPSDPAAPAIHPSVLLASLADSLGCAPTALSDMELCLYNTTPATVGGALAEYLFSPRCDNLVMSFTALSSLINVAQDAQHINAAEHISMMALFDNEEVGSLSAYGADSHWLESILYRITYSGVTPTTPSTWQETLPHSFLVSADMAHAVHPNYAEKHEENHQPALNGGIVLKHNANQRYATTAATSALFRLAAAAAQVSLQEFVVRNDSPCGSTIGPILSGKLGLRTLDVGNPQLSMHSIREQAGCHDIEAAIQVFTVLWQRYTQLDRQVQLNE